MVLSGRSPVLNWVCSPESEQYWPNQTSGWSQFGIILKAEWHVLTCKSFTILGGLTDVMLKDKFW